MSGAVGLAAERRLFAEPTEEEKRQGRTHAAEVERGTHAIPEAASAPRAIAKVGVIGGGTMGTGIATALLLSGLDVTLVETGADRARAAAAAIARNLAGAVDRGRLSAGEQAAAQARLRCTADLDALGTADLVIEAVFEDMAVKQDLFRRLDAVCRPGIVLATNTSYLDIAAIAAVTGRPQDVLGLHFFAPAHVMRLLEVVVTDSTAPEVVATGFALARRLGKVPVRSGVCDGFIGNRILARCRKVADHMLMDGADFAQIDRALEDAGFALGPYATADLSGLDIGHAMRQRRAASRPAAERYCRVGDHLCEAGALGRKAGRGYYLYEGSAPRTPNPEAEEIVAAERWASGVVTRPFGDDEIVARYLAAMICEAARILDEGIALRGGDIDAVLLFGYGFPRHLGGPMHMADRIGAARLAERVRAYAEEDAQFWQMPALLARLAATGGRFADAERDNRDGS